MLLGPGYRAQTFILFLIRPKCQRKSLLKSTQAHYSLQNLPFCSSKPFYDNENLHHFLAVNPLPQLLSNQLLLK